VNAMADTKSTKTDASADTSAARQRSRSIAIAAGLVFMVVIFYLITIFKMGANVLNRSL
jgi:hypothetical protein